MEPITDIVSGASDYMDGIILAIGGIITWFTTRFEWWKSQNKFVKVSVMVGVFVAVMLVLSVLNAVFT